MSVLLPEGLDANDQIYSKGRPLMMRYYFGVGVTLSACTLSSYAVIDYRLLL